MRPVERGDIPNDSQGQPKEYSCYANARRDLIERLGQFCSYCEMRLDTSLAVEHIQPKIHCSDLALRWDNFLLACTNCNSIKKDKTPALDGCLWPDVDNTFLAFEYVSQGIVKPAANLSLQLRAKAIAAIELTGLDRKPNLQTASDRRWQNRRETWGIANDSKQDLAEYDNDAMRRQIARTAEARGYWSIWMTVFADDSDMLNRLIQLLPGTATDCFDIDGQPVARTGGKI
ncbi:MAG: hypothetical protein ACI8WB_003730 [Phenylobacterium sp.]|jgi:uncharacterized protein (TIGR02646 family)